MSVLVICVSGTSAPLNNFRRNGMEFCERLRGFTTAVPFRARIASSSSSAFSAASPRFQRLVSISSPSFAPVRVHRHF